MRSFLFLDRLLILLSALLSLSLGIALFLAPQEEFSPTENRFLSTMTLPSLKELADGSFSENASRVCSDQFPLRSQWIALKAGVERGLGKRENNGILFGKDGILIPRGEYDALSLAEENLAAIRGFSRQTAIPVHTMVIPRHVDLLSAQLPSFFSVERASALANRLTEENNILFPLEEWKNHPELLYKTDHHWTTEGAFAAYHLLGGVLGYTPMEKNFFQTVTVSEGFRGSSHVKAGGSTSFTDRITLFRYDGDKDFLVEHETGQVMTGFYRWEFLSKLDQYGVFLGGNHARLEIRAPLAVARPRLLLIKDSFANSLLPFLAIHFDLTVLDLRYGTVPSEDLSSYDQILLLQGADTLATDGSLRKLALLSP